MKKSEELIQSIFQKEKEENEIPPNIEEIPTEETNLRKLYFNFNVENIFKQK